MSIVEIGGLVFEKYIDRSTILSKVEAIANQINSKYAGKEIVLVGVLKGAFVFLNDLMKHIQLPNTIEFIRVASYDGLNSSGDIQLLLDFPESIKDKHVILIEDIIDTGLTAHFLMERVRNFGAASVAIASLFVKPEALKTSVSANFYGFAIPNDFIIGYGLDYNEEGRGLPEVYKIVE